MVSRSGERHSPKRGREETWEFWARHLAQARWFWSSERSACSLRRKWLA